MKLTSILLLTTLLAGALAQAQTSGETRREQRRESPAAQACKNEIQQLCKGQTGQQAEQCLKNNQAKLSPQCSSALQTPPK